LQSNFALKRRSNPHLLCRAMDRFASLAMTVMETKKRRLEAGVSV
jgi:hypothetical protein